MARYNNTSPWANTPLNENYLGIFSIRPVSAEPDDALYTLSTVYTHRPDLLSYDLYDTPKLWWVFSQRNMDVIKDPIFDFVAGTQIYLPQKAGLFKVLGL